MAKKGNERQRKEKKGIEDRKGRALNTTLGLWEKGTRAKQAKKQGKKIVEEKRSRPRHNAKERGTLKGGVKVTNKRGGKGKK